jgi:hypothetical protein
MTCAAMVMYQGKQARASSTSAKRVPGLGCEIETEIRCVDVVGIQIYFGSIEICLRGIGNFAPLDS